MSPPVLSETARARSFGRTMGVVALIAAVWYWRHGRSQASEIATMTGVVLLLAGQFVPLVLRHPARLWFAIAHAMGWFNARVLLSIAYTIVLTPISLVWRMTGVDPLRRKRTDPRWVKYPARYADRSHYSRMY